MGVLATNLVGAAAFAFAVHQTAGFSDEVKAAFGEIGLEAMARRSPTCWSRASSPAG